ncbi:pyridoxal phosphate-dependent aminotransferase family protein [uncultured Algibacter sp.]|uniref:aminotransferase class I/II-fold pyridoxal phosphate-dependent enzyme n=1 Tax=uncultured Algibacter sp. TaxID=298659 RepID=UPI00262E9EA7|nr:pyridoxal phosphate-dependent aminotransferase family protein [uncultured Algibacter sp.]
MFPKKLQQKLEERKANNALRKLGVQSNLIDFSSNDYLGFSKSETIFNSAHEYLVGHNIIQNGSTGSRLLSGNNQLYNIIEAMLASFHNSETALVFNSGYDANVGFFSSVAQRGDIILYDEYIHASIRDGITMSNAKPYKFKHNNIKDLECHLERSRKVSRETNIYIATESVFSMDGDTPDLTLMSQICKTYNAFLVVDEAHALGVFGEQGVGIIQNLGLEKDIFARIITFGKAMGCHGSAILCSKNLKEYLVNFSRSFIYTTALPPHSLATIHTAYHELIISENLDRLHQNVQLFKSEIVKNKLQDIFIESHSTIHCCIISGNNKVKSISEKLQDNGFNVKPILSPTVPKGKERLRFCLNSYNSPQEITKVLNLLATFVT